MEKEKDPRKTELFRYNEKTGEWKKLTLQFTDDGAFFTIEEGKKGDRENNKKVSLKLSATEVAYLIMQMNKGYLKFIK